MAEVTAVADLAARPRAREEQTHAAWATRLWWTLDAVLFGYSQVFFTADRRVGAVLLLVTFVDPTLGPWGLAAILLSLGVVRLVRFSTAVAGRGLYSYNPLLVGLALGAYFEPSPTLAMLFVGAVIATVFVQTALESALGSFFNLPVLSLPFVLVTFMVLGAVSVFAGVAPASPAALAWDLLGFLPPLVEAYMKSLGAIFFTPGVLPGLLVFLALVIYSRIASMLSVGAFLLASFIVGQASLGSEVGPMSVATNAILVAVALGGVWFVPQPSAFLLAAGGVVLTVFFTLAAFVFLMPVHLPVLILPFNLALLTTLYAMRQREADGAPKAVDFMSGSPEANLNYFRTRLSRFGAASSLRLSLPFSGRWTVTQGFDGAHTHRGPWRHALDFEVRDAQDRNHSGDGAALKDYFCYRLPVVAAADGTVVKVVDDVPDNRVGERNPRDNFGNVVILQHGPMAFSLVAHLSSGSIVVSEGQFVRAGAKLGLCGNSGRSFTPHLHFQLQRTARIGAPTFALELHDVVHETGDGPRVHAVGVPAEGQAVRNLEKSDQRARLFALPFGTRWRFEVASGRRRAVEIVTAKIDLLSNLYLEDEEHNRLYFENQARELVIYDYVGEPFTALHLLYLAAPRVPFEEQPRLTWADVVSDRHLRQPLVGVFFDLIDPFIRRAGATRALSSEATADGVVVHGTGQIRGQEAPSAARFSSEGPIELRLRLGSVEHIAKLVEVTHAS